MINPCYTFIILTCNEEKNLPRLLNSIQDLNACIYLLDSGSIDDTLQIAAASGISVEQNPFINHPRQWDYALKTFNVKTPWIIGLDADQIVSAELKQRLINFRDKDYKGIDGIYFNRKTHFKGKWIKYGGCYPFYLLKMFRHHIGYSDLNENMDHRFIVPGKTVIWKDVYLLEENLKENSIQFWIDKHNRYSDLLAIEEVERKQQLRTQTITPAFWGNQDEHRAWLKRVWWQLPLFLRPALYFIYRYFFRLGILDGYQGFVFHFLQGFWFRLLVDIKIKEILDRNENN